MCGIIGYAGKEDCAQFLLDGLQRLEYRGYDSAGVAIIGQRGLQILRCRGKLSGLAELVGREKPAGATGMGHTRWATHGRPSDENAHPHAYRGVAVVHNGIIENHLELKETLGAAGHAFASETDTEIFAHLIADESQDGRPLAEAVRRALARVRGTYALVVVSEREPGTLVAVKNASPLVIGFGQGENFLASDVPALLERTRDFVFMEEGDLAVLTRDGVRLEDAGGQPVSRPKQRVDWTPVMAEKGGHKHFMHKEIHEQPRAVADTLRGRASVEQGDALLDEAGLDAELASRLQRACIVACGTSWHAGLVGKHYLERFARIPVEVDLGSEFRYRDPVVGPETLCIAISQSGETADTLAAVKEARSRGARVLAVCNVVGSAIAREAGGVVYTHAGPEIGVASTKCFTTQLAALLLLAVRLGRARGTLDEARGRALVTDLRRAPSLMEEALQGEAVVQEVALKAVAHARDALFLGRGLQHPIALEGALKLKEISYLHAEGYAAGEMKHGPIALIDEGVPVVVIAPRAPGYEKVVSNIEEVRARGGTVIAVGTRGDAYLKKLADHVLEIPETPAEIAPLVTVLPLQLLAYHVADHRGTDVDQPRNLAKSVTVE